MKLVLAILFVGVAAHAQTRFDDVKAMYTKGTILDARALEAAYSGRCFVRDQATSPDDATGALLVGRKFGPSAPGDAGPAFPSQDRLIVNLFNAIGTDVHYRFDNWSYAQALQMLASPQTSSTPVEQNGIDLQWRTNYQTGSSGAFYARLYQNYIVVYSVNSATQPNDEYACYFYNRLP